MAACAPADDGLGGDFNVGAVVDYQQAAPFIEVAPSSPLSLALRGGIGPIVEGQTVNAAQLALDSIQLVGEDGSVVPLIDEPMTLDLLAAQNGLEGLASQITLPPGRFSHMRCQLGGMFIETRSAQGGVQFFATPGMDYQQFAPTGPVGPLGLDGMQPGGFFDVAIPPDGIVVDGATSLAMQIDLASSLIFQDGGWVFSPRAWVVNESVLSSLEVRFEAEAAGFSQFVEQGAEVMLFDAGMRPISYAPLAMLPGGIPGASFQYLAPFQGPFVAVLVPPPGVQLANVVSVSVDVAASVHAQTSIVVNSFQQVGMVGGVASYQVGFAEQASFVQFGAAGGIIGRSMVPVGPIQAIAPQVGPRVPLLPGQAPLPRVGRVPYLRGLPAPSWVHGGILPGGPPRFHERHHRPGGIHRPGVRPGGPGFHRPGRPGFHRPGERPGRPGIFPGERPGRPGFHRPGERPGRPGILPGERPGRPGFHRPGERPGGPGVLPGERPGRPGFHRPGERPGGPGFQRPFRPSVSPGGPGVHRPSGPAVSPGARPGRPGVSPGVRPGGSGVHRPGGPTVSPGVRPSRPGPSAPTTRPTTRPSGERPGFPGIQRPRTDSSRSRGERLEGTSTSSAPLDFPGIEAPEPHPEEVTSDLPHGGAPPLTTSSPSRPEPRGPRVIMRPIDRTVHHPTEAESNIPLPLPRGLTEPQSPASRQPPARGPEVIDSELKGQR